MGITLPPTFDTTASLRSCRPNQSNICAITPLYTGQIGSFNGFVISMLLDSDVIDDVIDDVGDDAGDVCDAGGDTGDDNLVNSLTFNGIEQQHIMYNNINITFIIIKIL